MVIISPLLPFIIKRRITEIINILLVGLVLVNAKS